MIIVPTDRPATRWCARCRSWASTVEGGHCVRFVDCRVPRKNLLGQRGDGFRSRNSGWARAASTLHALDRRRAARALI